MKRAWLTGMLMLLAVIGLSSCTVTPKTVRDKTASFDGNQQNSGFLGYDGEGYGIITSNALARYNGLIAKYGERYAPPLKPNAGVTPHTNGTFRIDNAHDVRAREMNRWRRSGL
jgi:hypothetical protein